MKALNLAPGYIVWAKHGKQDWECGEVLSCRGNDVMVQFFSNDNTATIVRNDVINFVEGFPAFYQESKRHDWKRGVLTAITRFSHW
jgi:hypothetical protein